MPQDTPQEAPASSSPADTDPAPNGKPGQKLDDDSPLAKIEAPRDT